MKDAQGAYLEKLLLSSAIPPDVRRDAHRVLADPEVGVEQLSLIHI